MSKRPVPVTRKMTDEERAMILARCPQPQLEVNTVQGFVVFFVLLILLVFFCSHLSDLQFQKKLPEHIAAVLALAGCVGFFGVTILLWLLMARRSKPKSPYDRDLAIGKMAVYHYTVMAATRLVPTDDTVNCCPAFFLQFDDGSLLFLMGEYLADPVQEGRFPCGQFDVIRLRNKKETLRIDCTGTPLDASLVRILEGVDKAFLPSDHEVITAQMEALPELLHVADETVSNEIPEEMPTISRATLPATIDPRLRFLLGSPGKRYLVYGLRLLVCTGILALFIDTLLRGGEPVNGNDVNLGSVIVCMLVLLYPIITWMHILLNTRSQMLRLHINLRLATKMLREMTPIPMRVIMHYQQFIIYRGGRFGTKKCIEGHYFIELPTEFTLNNGLPHWVEIYPPMGRFTEIQAKLDKELFYQSQDGTIIEKFNKKLFVHDPDGPFTHELYAGQGKVYVGECGMVVIATHHDYLVRKIDVKVTR